MDSAGIVGGSGINSGGGDSAGIVGGSAIDSSGGDSISFVNGGEMDIADIIGGSGGDNNTDRSLLTICGDCTGCGNADGSGNNVDVHRDGSACY